MAGANAFLVALTTVLGAAAVTTVLFQRIRQPVVLGYLLAGVLVGPHVPFPLVADPALVQTLSELGVVLLMFSLGLDFRVRKLARLGPSATVTALVQCSIMLWLGFTAGRLLGWTRVESIFAGAMVAISSTTIVARTFEELGVRGPLRDLVMGVLVVQDLVAVLLIAALTALARGSGLSAGALGATAGRLAFFLAALLAVGFLVVPRALRAVRGLDRPETTLVATLGLCFGVALLAHHAGYSVALGAFIAGSLVAESGQARYVEHLVRPVRDMFAAVFFVSIGMMIDPALLVRHAGAVAAFTALVLVGQVGSVTFGAFLTGQGARTAVQAGLSLAQIGEFSFIIAGLGLALGATRDFLYPVAVAVSAVTTLTTPWLVRGSDRIAAWVDRKLPRPVQTLASLYASWLERVHASPSRGTAAALARRIGRMLALDAALLAAVIIAAAVAHGRVTEAIGRRTGLAPDAARWLVLLAAAALSVPFCAGILRNARRLGAVTAAAALPALAEGRPDLAAAPRRALTVTLQLAAVILVGLPVVAVTAPFLPGAPGIAVLAVLVAVLGLSFWRSARDLEGHVRAGAHVLLEALARQAGEASDPLREVRELLPGLGEPSTLHLVAGSPAIGRTLAELDLRGVTGASVLAIWRRGGGVIVPSAREVLREGDVLAVAGAGEAVDAARRVLSAADAPPPARHAR
jgi:monovalent cation:H+ antiporter-2, CPA2 family